MLPSSWLTPAAFLFLALTSAAAPPPSSPARRSYLGRRRSQNALHNPFIASLQVDPSNIRLPSRTKRQSCAEPGPSGTCALCTAGLTLCSGQCVDTTQDLNNCGGCGQVCDTGQVCLDSACCAPENICDGLCNDYQTDINNCGSCGATCIGGSCEGGSCVCDPDADLVFCNGACITPDYFTNENCGACGQTCNGVCAMGVHAPNGPTCYTTDSPVGTSVTGIIVGYLPGTSGSDVYCYFVAGANCADTQETYELLQVIAIQSIPTFTATYGASDESITANTPDNLHGEWYISTAAPTVDNGVNLEPLMTTSQPGSPTADQLNAFAVTDDGYITTLYSNSVEGVPSDVYPWFAQSSDYFPVFVATSSDPSPAVPASGEIVELRLVGIPT